MTGSRAEFGLLRWLMEDIRDDPALLLQLVVTGAHLLPEYGSTLDEIREAGFVPDETVAMALESDAPVDVTRALGQGTAGMGASFARLAPDAVVVLGDRYEILGAAQAALVAGIPVGHIHGGERSEGAIDESIRHAVTKMAHLHFVATEEYRRRVIQLGEAPDRVFCVGAPGLDSLARLPRMSRGDLEARLGHALSGPVAVVTYHPATLGSRPPAVAVEALLGALEGFDDLRVVFTGVNADPGARGIARSIEAFVARAPARRSLHLSLGHEAYLSLLDLADVCVGNSSSGLIEAPAVDTPTVDVGPRQRGRVRGATVLHAEEESGAIASAIRTALDPGFRSSWPVDHTPYGGPGASTRIRDTLRDVDLRGLTSKEFHDLPESGDAPR